MTLESFQLCLLVAFDRSNLSEPSDHIFQKVDSSLEVKIAKEKFSGNPGHRILEIYNEVKQNLISNTINSVYELPHELSNDLI